MSEVDKAKAIIRRLLDETTYPAYAGEACRSCEGDANDHEADCPWLLAVSEAGAFLTE